MEKKELASHKKAFKQLSQIPSFNTHPKNKFPKPFKGVGGPRIQTTGFFSVAEHYQVFMFWKDGAILTDRSFYAYLFFVLPNNDKMPIFELHWHPSHKGIHCKTPCRAKFNYINRGLPGALELAVKTSHLLDPKNSQDRLKLVMIFCEACGISLPDNDPISQRLYLC